MRRIFLGLLLGTLSCDAFSPEQTRPVDPGSDVEPALDEPPRVPPSDGQPMPELPVPQAPAGMMPAPETGMVPASDTDAGLPGPDESPAFDAGSSEPSPPADPTFPPSGLSESALPPEAERADAFPGAHQLAQFLWYSEPELELWLWDAIGGLNDLSTRTQLVSIMLEDPRFGRGVAAFISSWARFANAGSIRERQAYPGLDAPRFQRAAKLELQDFVVDEVLLGANLTRLLNAEYELRQGYLRELFAGEPTAPGLSPLGRVGLLQQPLLLAASSFSDVTLATRRALFVNESLLCSSFPDPPGELDIEPLVPAADQTSLEALQARTADPACAACHSVIDPLGIPFEEFDTLGAYRTEENGRPIQNFVADIPLLLSGGASGSRELSQRLASDGRSHHCFAATWFTYALGRPISPEQDGPSWSVIADLAQRHAPLSELVRAIALSDSFVRCSQRQQELGQCPSPVILGGGKQAP